MSKKRTTRTPVFGSVQASFTTPLAVLVAAVLVYLLGRNIVTPWVAHHVEPLFPGAGGPHLFLQHLLTFSLPTATLCLVAWVGFARANLLPSPRQWLWFGRSWRLSLAYGAVTGIALSAVVVIIALVDEQALGFHPNSWMIVGNGFSNYYEELEYRGLLTVAGASAFNSRWAGVVTASLLFGWSHGGKGLPFMLLVGAVGLVFGWLWIRTRSLGAPWAAHQVSDAILDSL